MVFQSAIPPSVALVFAPEALVGRRGQPRIAFLSAGIAVALARARSSVPALVRRRLTGRGLLVGGVFYLAYLGCRHRVGGS